MSRTTVLLGLSALMLLSCRREPVGDRKTPSREEVLAHHAAGSARSKAASVSSARGLRAVIPAGYSVVLHDRADSGPLVLSAISGSNYILVSRTEGTARPRPALVLDNTIRELQKGQTGFSLLFRASTTLGGASGQVVVFLNGSEGSRQRVQMYAVAREGSLFIVSCTCRAEEQGISELGFRLFLSTLELLPGSAA